MAALMPALIGATLLLALMVGALWRCVLELDKRADMATRRIDLLLVRLGLDTMEEVEAIDRRNGLRWDDRRFRYVATSEKGDG